MGREAVRAEFVKAPTGKALFTTDGLRAEARKIAVAQHPKGIVLDWALVIGKDSVPLLRVLWDTYAPDSQARWTERVL